MVGKTSIIQRYIDNLYIDSGGTQPTLAWDFKVMNLNYYPKSRSVETVPNLKRMNTVQRALINSEAKSVESDESAAESIRLFIWDTAGQERFRHIARMYYKDIQGVILVFDLTSEESFKNINFWISDIQKHGPEKLVQVLVGNKNDLANADDTMDFGSSDREVGYEDAF